MLHISRITHTSSRYDSEEKAHEVLGAIDLNGDGAISYDEFKVRACCSLSILHHHCASSIPPSPVSVGLICFVPSTHLPIPAQAMMEAAGSTSRIMDK